VSGHGHYADGLVDDVMVVGVGGQGVIVAAAIVADTALLHGGLDVKLSETRGMSQRGGSVCSHIRIGEKVVAPSISPGEVDYLLAFEAAEGLRFASRSIPVAWSSSTHSRSCRRSRHRALSRTRSTRSSAWTTAAAGSSRSTATPWPGMSVTSRSPAWCWSALSPCTCPSRPRLGSWPSRGTCRQSGSR